MIWPPYYCTVCALLWDNEKNHSRAHNHNKPARQGVTISMDHFCQSGVSLTSLHIVTSASAPAPAPDPTPSPSPAPAPFPAPAHAPAPAICS